MIDIESILSKGETQSIEFKKSLNQMREACKSLCGMLNTVEGFGRVIFGISPENEIVGLEGDLDSIQKTLVQHIKQKFEPSITISLLLEEHEKKNILILSAERARGVKYYEYDGRTYIKEGSTRRVMTIKEKEMLQRTPYIDPVYNLIIEIAPHIFDIIIFGEQYEQRIVKPWFDILRNQYRKIFKILIEFAFKDVLIQKGLDKKLIELSNSLEKIINMRLCFGCSQELEILFQSTIGKATSFKQNEIDLIPLSEDFYNNFKETILMNNNKLFVLNKRAGEMIKNYRSEEIQSEASEIGYSLLKLSFYNVQQIPNEFRLGLHDIAEKLHLLETFKFYSNQKKPIKTMEDIVNNLSTRLNALIEEFL